MIGEFVKLKRVGTSFRGPCPFHHGKNPNFSVTARGGYKCFKCGESGDVFTRSADGTPVTRTIDRTEIGDILAFCTAGAYGFSMASHYNARLLPAEVLVDGNEVTLIRERQEYADLLRSQR